MRPHLLILLKQFQLGTTCSNRSKCLSDRSHSRHHSQPYIPDVLRRKEVAGNEIRASCITAEWPRALSWNPRWSWLSWHGFCLVPSRLPPLILLGLGELQRKGLVRNVFRIPLETQLISENFSLDYWPQHCPLKVRQKCVTVTSFWCSGLKHWSCLPKILTRKANSPLKYWKCSACLILRTDERDAILRSNSERQGHLEWIMLNQDCF